MTATRTTPLVMGKYSEDTRAACIAFLIAQGYPEQIGALKSASDHFGVTRRVLRRWFNEQNPMSVTSNEKVQQARRSLEEQLLDVVDALTPAIIRKVNEQWESIPLSSLTEALQVVSEKVLLLRGDATSRLDINSNTSWQMLAREKGISEDLIRERARQFLLGDGSSSEESTTSPVVIDHADDEDNPQRPEGVGSSPMAEGSGDREASEDDLGYDNEDVSQGDDD